MSIRNIKGGITAVAGFRASGIASGIKKNGRSDLALIFSETPATAAAVFTKNQCPASSITFNKRVLRSKKGQAIIVNSGNANAATGDQGMCDTKTMAAITADCLGLSPHLVYVASTGVIGEPLPIDKIAKGVPILASALSNSGGLAAAEAIITTDTFVKEVACVGKVGSREVCIGGIAKGSGMIHPNMATMLAFLTTDATIRPDLLQEALQEVTDRTFNCTTVDGETSTNDLVILLANGQKKTDLISKKGEAFSQFVSILYEVCRQLSQMIVKDGEGATKFITVAVSGAMNDQAARAIAMSISKSSLVKTAFFGQDANWGRIVCAIGNTKAKINLLKLDITFGSIRLIRNGVHQGKRIEDKVSEYLKEKEVSLSVDLKSGSGSSTIWTSDLSYDYVKINAAYRS
ncbi:MAG: bifunctional glutamate N-acetyltransferase/amino-acid acetyltransferase ArgJ [Nitrospirota bacterium]